MEPEATAFLTGLTTIVDEMFRTNESASNRAIESVNNAIPDVSAENLNSASKVMGTIAIGAIATGQVEIAAPAGMASFGLSVASAALSPNPAEGIATEVMLQVTGVKAVGTVAKVAGGIIESSKPIVKNSVAGALAKVESDLKDKIKTEM